VVNISVLTDNGRAGNGSGFVIDTAGHIVTNGHVVSDARYVEVTFVDGTLLTADVIGIDTDSDLAVIQVEAAEAILQPVTFADSDQVFVGQQTLAIGSPFGQDFTLTTGIVSAIDRSLVTDSQFSIPELIQTDAAINPGNSGGPLLDRAGNVLGVNTAILSSTQANAGVGFAVPSNAVRRIVPYLIADGKFEHSWLGISGAAVEVAMREAMNLPDGLAGVMVSRVTATGPAGQAGLRGATGFIDTPLRRLPVNGDIITAVDGNPVSQMNDLVAYLDGDTLPGQTVMVTVWRDGQMIELPVTLRERPQ
jgi:2-alkenal reductase